MKKFTFLMLLLSMAAGASAKIITSAPKADTPYKIKCIATDHTGYLGDDKTTLQGRHAEGTFFVLEQAEDGKEGHYYLKSKESGKYINAAEVKDGGAITFDDDATTYWTVDQERANRDKYSWAIRPDGNAEFSLNNNNKDANAKCPWMKVIKHNDNTQGCALWTFDDGLQYDELTPELPVGKYVISLGKADRLASATSAGDNKHWYLLTQARGEETPMYDNGNDVLKRAAVGTQVDGKLLSGNERYLVRFFEDEVEGRYFMQFATGNFITQDLKTGSRATSGTFNFYNINDQDTHFGWNEPDYARIVDNNGPGANINYWSSGRVTNLNGNNDWSLYAVDFVDGVDIEYTIYSEDGTSYKGSYVTGWNGDNTTGPVFAGADGYTLNSVNFDKDGDNYSMTANITFPFPVGEHVTGIESELGNSKWLVEEDGVIRASSANQADWTFTTQAKYKWCIYPSFDKGTFSFKIKHHATGKYIPKLDPEQQNTDTENKMVDGEENAGLFYLMPCIGDGRGFSVDETGDVFLTINSVNGKNQPVWTWTKTGSHKGSNLSFPDVTISEEKVKNQFEPMASITPFEILGGSTVVGPSEFANPEDINAAIAKAKSVDINDVDAMFAFNNSGEAAMLKNYLAQVERYGKLHTCKFEFDGYQYATLILPCPATRPDGIKLYSCNGVGENNVLTLSEIGGNLGENKPYIIEHTGNNNGKYTIIGWFKKNNPDLYTDGCLTGVLAEEGATVPVNSYKFDKGNQRFVKNAGEETEESPVTYSNESETFSFICPQHECYFTLPSDSEIKADELRFTYNGTVSIADIFVDRNGKTEIYDLNGRRLPSLQKGINIVNGHKILVK